MVFTDDPIRDSYRYQDEQDSGNVTCDQCGQTVWNYIWMINGDRICEDCLNAQYRVDVDDILNP